MESSRDADTRPKPVGQKMLIKTPAGRPARAERALLLR